MEKTDKEIEEIGSLLEKRAQEIARKIERKVLGPFSHPNTWVYTATCFGFIVYPFKADSGVCRGEFIRRPGRSGIITYNTSLSYYRQCRVLVHEIAHGIMLDEDYARGFLYLGCRGERSSYDDDPNDVRHRIARRVEQIVFSKPD